jgi:hypothetical protein
MKRTAKWFLALGVCLVLPLLILIEVARERRRP